MGMKLKPSKCRSLSLSSGSSKVVEFFIRENRIPSISEEEQKFLGRVIFYTGKSSETLLYLRNTLTEKLDNIERTLLRPEYKLWIYAKYLLPSIRFLLTVHDVTASNLKILDRLTHKYMKMGRAPEVCHQRNLSHP